MLKAAVQALAKGGFTVERMARVRNSAPLGPSTRTYANSAVLGRWSGDPQGLLRLCKEIEQDFGRRPGQRWGARVLDIDIWLIGGLTLHQPALIIPHVALSVREFALQPLVELLPGWRHPELHLTARQMLHRLRRQRPVDFTAATD